MFKLVSSALLFSMIIPFRAGEVKWKQCFPFNSDELDKDLRDLSPKYYVNKRQLDRDLYPKEAKTLPIHGVKKSHTPTAVMILGPPLVGKPLAIQYVQKHKDLFGLSNAVIIDGDYWRRANEDGQRLMEKLKSNDIRCSDYDEIVKAKTAKWKQDTLKNALNRTQNIIYTDTILSRQSFLSALQQCIDRGYRIEVVAILGDKAFVTDKWAKEQNIPRDDARFKLSKRRIHRIMSEINDCDALKHHYKIINNVKNVMDKLDPLTFDEYDLHHDVKGWLPHLHDDHQLSSLGIKFKELLKKWVVKPVHPKKQGKTKADSTVVIIGVCIGVTIVVLIAILIYLSRNVIER